MTGAPILRLEAATLAIAGRRLVDAVDLEVHPGSLTVLVGPNGAGKTSLLKLASGELRATAGRVTWDGIDVAALPAAALAAIRTVMSQSTEIGFSFRVEEVVELGIARIGRWLVPAHCDEIVAEAMIRADVGHLVGRDVRALSGGERQRVLFAKALAQLDAGGLVGSRRALLLDEPVANLDLSHQIGLMEAAREVAATGVAVVAVLHDLNLAAAHADRIVAMAEGRIRRIGPPEAVLDDDLLAEVFALSPRRPAISARAVVPQTWRVRETARPRSAR
jgi:iron complex transport system ATP-binding protein